MPRGTLNGGLTGPTATYSFGKITTIKATQPAFKTQPGTANADILVVAGGGGGAPGGGGGAGGFLQHPNSPVSAASSYTVTVGAGSTSTSRNTGNAGNSQFLIASKSKLVTLIAELACIYRTLSKKTLTVIG